MSADLDIHHVRRPALPWRIEAVRTECGLVVEGMALAEDRVWTRDQLAAKARELGAQRLSYLVCMTCLSTAQRWPSWEQDPVQCLGREIHGRDQELFHMELRAIAALIAAHEGEFHEFMAGLAEAPSLEEARRARRRRR